MTNTGLYNNRNSKAILAFFITMFYLVNPLFSQDREDNQFWTGFDLEYTLFDDLTLEVQNELRQERNAASFRSYYFNLGAKYKIFSFFRVGSFYRYKIHPDYRENAAYVNLYQNFDLGIFEISNRLRFYGRFPENSKDDDKYYIRDLLSIGLKFDKFTPYIAAELHYRTLYDKGDRFDEIRYYIGSEMKISKHHKIDLFILYKNEINVKKPEYDLVFGLFYEVSLN